jgi:omega-amidase
MTEDLHLACIQAKLLWEDKPGNLGMFELLIADVSPSCDLILLPEVFNTGFSMNPERLAERMDGRTVQWMQDMARMTGSVLCGTLLIEEAGQYVNRLVWVTPDGVEGYYDKRHLFSMGREREHFHPGVSRSLFRVKGWNVMPLVCYDLRFPVWSMNGYHGGSYAYDLLVYLANWPTPRRNHWRQLLTARAIENQAFVAGVNRTGTDGNDISHSGHTMVIDAYGLTLAEAGEEPMAILTTTLSRESLEAYRSRFPLGADWDH